MRALYRISRQALAIAAGLAVCAQGAAQPPASHGIERLRQPEATTLPPFDRDQSAGLFVGVNSFSHGLCDGCAENEKKIADLRFDVDDAIDLAYRFSVQLGLIPPHKVRLLLAGQPWKEISRLRLDELARSGAIVIWQASKADILSCLSHLVGQHSGRSGLLVVSVASHGIIAKGDDYILGSDAVYEFLPETGLRTATLLDITSRAPSARRLILIDACREKITEDARGTGPDPQTASSKQRSLLIGQTEGLAVIVAARTGAWSYDDDRQKNGVFTRALLDSLQCEPCSDRDQEITVSTLAAAVDQRVADWTSVNRPALTKEKRGITRNTEGSIAAMPLLLCPRVQVPDACQRSALLAIEVLNKEGAFRRFRLDNGRITLPVAEFEAVDELVGRPVFGGAQDSAGCPWRWEELHGLEWQELASRPGGAFSISKPSQGRVASLRLMLCGAAPKEVDLIVQ